MNIKFTVLAGILLLSLGSIAYFSSKETSYTLLDASELAASPAKYQDNLLRVRGFVKLGSVIREGKTARFILEFNEKQIPVFFTGETLLPDAFKEGTRARVDGYIKDGVLVSDHVEAKCASKYEADYSEENK
ncbi:cytochrome c maturation protein CcmE domain-containing protein [Leptospira borgpetersenii]|uniref:cytochrome c maturation protein CcmE domain-containing protein n=1 Tax=Leptospira borgpetersenii TaxID=174 RepID=UPI0007736B6B|nr:cytochrome c maturation protein CcmE [Leptospira borgpetersenii]MBE8400797.1 cytochrome c maturation protein CcmE [Leptospira borgpetersenii serovar Tarassovi]MBE8403905.1 cytochrome c maturation protein CcmE [Leptospira borgpetersenii serovar Tarassovi]MBE8406924.1 cytochrome c maturation protein CcmE [Leptospira borgpetersenii serovar Tarassovi]MBE8413319.1 cytochrome c maturation protein CcmE [Leptospira borgpetersenii serovar Tarassovi]MBE8416487.1 cytochrome c maturation protein CcmE [